jgi:hypothetical protein
MGLELLTIWLTHPLENAVFFGVFIFFKCPPRASVPLAGQEELQEADTLVPTGMTDAQQHQELVQSGFRQPPVGALVAKAESRFAESIVMKSVMPKGVEHSLHCSLLLRCIVDPPLSAGTP